MIYDAADELLDVGVGVGVGVDVGVGVVGVDGGVVDVGVGVGLCVRVGVGELLSCGADVGEKADAVGLLCTGDAVGVLSADSLAVARLLAALLLPWPCAELVADGAGLMVAEPAPDAPVLCGFAPVRPEAGVLPALRVVPGAAAERRSSAASLGEPSPIATAAASSRTRVAPRTAWRERCRTGSAVLPSSLKSILDICGRSGGRVGSRRSVSMLSSEGPGTGAR